MPNPLAPVDLSLNASWILPVCPRGTVLVAHSLLIKDDKIVGIEPRDTVDQQYQVAKHLDLEGRLLMPGMLNCHGHAAMTLMRGIADDLPLETWLHEHIWPAEARWVSEEFVAEGTRLAIAEMLLSGSTLFSDMYFFPEVAAEVAHDCGMRAQLVFPVVDFGNNWSRDADDAIHKGLKLRDRYRSHPLIEVGFGPHAPYSVSDGPLKRIATYAEELQAPVQIHLHESREEISGSIEQYGKRPIERLQDLGLLSPLTQCVHMTNVVDSDIALLSESGAHVIHCPQSNMKLAAGCCPAQKFLDAGVNVALGTDGAASNNDLDQFAEMQTAALLAKMITGNPAALDATTVIEMATIRAARALGLEETLGSLEVGKQADVIAVDLNTLRAQPMYHPASQLIYTGAGNHVTHSWIAGQTMVADSRLCQINTDELLAYAQKWQQHLLEFD